MSTQAPQQERVERAFLAALHFATEASTGALSETRLIDLCEDDDAVAAEVASLLRHAVKADGASRGKAIFLDPSELHGRRQSLCAPIGQSHDIAPGYWIEHFVITGQIGAGGMGVVYQARDTNLRRTVALKFLRPDYSRDADTRGRFLREARIASALNHPHICTIYSLEEFNGQPFVVMEFVEGKTLRALAGERLPLEKMIRLMEQTAQALDAAHREGIVHRDIKPENLMVRDDFCVKVLDFGVARFFADIRRKSLGEGGGTASGVLIGTTRYMSPEQARCEEATAACDIFSLGIVFYELATGQHPFAADHAMGVLEAISAHAAVSPRLINAEIPLELESLLLAMLEKSPENRPTAQEVIVRLRALSASSTSARHIALPPRSRPQSVGRRCEREIIHGAFAQAAAGHGQILCISGEAGIGKSTLVEDVFSEIVNHAGCTIARGRCSERLAGVEAYLPLLEALDDMIRGPDGAAIARVMKAAAPAWHGLLRPSSASADGTMSPDPNIAARLQERLKLELAFLFQELGRSRTIVLFLDDFHWADVSTVDLILYIGAKCPSLRLLIMLAYRPVELLLRKHAFGPVKLELESKGLCREIRPGFLSAEEVDAYLAIAFPDHRLPEAFSPALRKRTGGNPLFMVDLARYLHDEKVIVEIDGHWTIADVARDWERDLPPSVRSLIEKKLGQLSDPDRRLLVAASVQGNEFDAAVVAKALQLDPAEVEERLEVLGRVHGLVRVIREHEFPSGTLTIRFAFVHILYQDALYASLQPARKSALSAAVAAALCDFYGERKSQIAAELATLYEASRDRTVAAEYFAIAAQHAVRIFATREAAELSARGLAAIEALPDSPQRARRELSLQMNLAVSLQALNGFADANVARAYARTRVLCHALGDDAQLFPALWGICLYQLLSGDMKSAMEVGQQLIPMAIRSRDESFLMVANLTIATLLLHTGKPRAALEATQVARGFFDPQAMARHLHVFGGLNHGVACRSLMSWAYCMLGQLDLALQTAIEATAILSPPMATAHAMFFAAFAHEFRVEAEQSLKWTDRLLEHALEHGLKYYHCIGITWRGRALTNLERREEGISELRAGLAACRAIGMKALGGQMRAFLAEALVAEKQFAEARALLAEALSLTQETGEVYYDAELYRIHGLIELSQFPQHPQSKDLARSQFNRALEIASEQGALSLQHRAEISLAALDDNPTK